MKRFRSVFSAVGALVCTSCGQSDPAGPPDLQTGRSHQPVWAGNGNLGSNDATGIMHTVLGLGNAKPGANFGQGTGIALNNRWVLTATHVRSGASVRADDFQNIQADFGSGSPTYTATGVVELHDANAPLVSPDLLYDLELYKFDNPPIQINGKSSGFQTPVSQKETSDIVALGAVECWGYGDGGPNGPVGILRQALLNTDPGPFTGIIEGTSSPRTFGPKINFFTKVTNGQQLSHGDSGGPCFAFNSNELVGIIRAKAGTSDPSNLGMVTSAGAFSGLNRHLSRMATNDPDRAFFADIDFDGNPDLAMLAAVDDGTGFIFADPQLQIADTSQYPPNLVPDDGFIDLDPLLPFRVPASEIPNAALTFGDFNANGAQDFVGFIAGNFLYLDGDHLTIPTPHDLFDLQCLSNPNDCFAPLFNNYTSVNVSDVNGDGFDDLEAFDETDIYYGSSRGLTNGVEMAGFPTSDGRDGKFITLAVRPVASVGVPDYTFSIRRDTNLAPDLHIEIFDGDLSGSHDSVTANADSINTCYRLYADPDQHQQQPAVTDPTLATADQTQFANNAWTSLVPVGTTDNDLGGGAAAVAGLPGVFAYTLRIFLSTDACDQEPNYPTDPVANAIKIRSDADIAFVAEPDPVIGVAGAISFRGSDSLGEFSAVDDCTSSTCDVVELQDVDTTYDGDWVFEVDAAGGTFVAGGIQTTLVNSIWLADADADSTLDKRSKGNATGASDTINFAIEDDTTPDHTVLFQPSHPSGQYDPDLEPCVNYNVAVNSPETLPLELRWHWTQVLTHNNIWMSIPASQPAGQCVDPAPDPPPLISFLLRGEKPRKPVPTTSASPEAFWESTGARDTLAQLLPIIVGERGSCGRLVGRSFDVRTLGQARAVFKAADEPADKQHPDRTSHLVEALEGEILAAKLNISRGLQHNERISRGFVYGTGQTISDLMAQADDAIGRSCVGLECVVGRTCEHNQGGKGGHVTPPSNTELQALIDSLRALNAGRVTYRVPAVPAQPVSTAASTRAPANATPHVSGVVSEFWKKD